MQMSGKTSKQLAEETIAYAGQMSPMTRNDFIDLISDQYLIADYRRYPKREVKKFSDLLTKLIKKFGN
jgi:hypothetical protein